MDQEQGNYVHKKFGRARVGSGEDEDTTINTNSNKADHDLQPQRNRLPSPTCGTILRPQAIRAQPAIMESPLVFLVPAVCMSTGCRLPGPLPYTPYTHYTTPYARQPPAPVFPPSGGLHPTHSFVPPKINSPPPSLPSDSLSQGPGFDTRRDLPAAPQPLSLPPDVSFMRVNNTGSSTADSTSSPVTNTVTNTVNDNRVKRPRKPKDDDLVPTFVKNELTRTDIVDSNIEDFNNKCADKPEEHRTILKDKRRKGKNRVAAKKSRERKINNLKELRIVHKRLEKEDRELIIIAQQYMKKKEQLKLKEEWLRRKVAKFKQRKFQVMKPKVLVMHTRP